MRVLFVEQLERSFGILFRFERDKSKASGFHLRLWRTLLLLVVVVVVVVVLIWALVWALVLV